MRAPSSQISFRLRHKIKSSCHNALLSPASSSLFLLLNLKRRAKKGQKKQLTGCSSQSLSYDFFKLQEHSQRNRFFLQKLIFMPSLVETIGANIHGEIFSTYFTCLLT